MCDMYRFGLEALDASLEIDTSQSQVGRPEDRLMLEELIASRGGFARLGSVIKSFRRRMQAELSEFLKVNHAMIARSIFLVHVFFF